MKKNVLKELYLQWDGTHTAYLKNLYREYRDDPALIPATLALLETAQAVEVSCSWVLKHHVDQGEMLSSDQVDQLVKKMAGLRFWESRLHLLQIIPNVSLTPAHAEQLEPSIRPLLFADKKFVKAAAFTAYFEIVTLIPELQHEFRLICEDALEKASASVNVRIRRVLKHLKT
jgi:hypothetical protein